jgi:TP901 family phage tail tape measure protein
LGASDYSVLLRARLDTSQIGKDVSSIQAEINKKMSSGGTRQVSAGLKVIDITKDMKSLDQIQSRIEEVKGKYQNWQSSSTTSGSTVTNTLLKYKDVTGATVTETYKLAGANAVGENQFSKTTKAVEGSSKAIGGWRNDLVQTIQRTIQYATSIGLVYGALNQLKQGIQYVTDLNREMTNIRVVTGGSVEEIDTLASGYNKLAKEMGATTLEVARGSLEFVRQGKTSEETAILIKNATMMAKLGNMDMAESSEALTSIMNGFKLSAEETGDVVNRLLAIDNVAATSIMELSTAMRYSSNSAQQVGVDMEHLAAYIGTVSSVTRLSEETIGQAFKTIFSRMTSIKNMKAFDTEGEAIDVNKVEAALDRVGIKLRDDNKQFRNMQDVLDEIGAKWDTMAKEDQLNIAEQIANVRQKETFLVLMNNQLEMQKELNAEADSAGLKEERYKIFLEGVEAAQNRLTSAKEEFWRQGIESGVISQFYDFLATVLELTTALGGLKTILGGVVLGLIAFNGAQIKTIALAMWNYISGMAIVFGELATQEGIATAAQWLLNIAMDANPIGVVIAAVTLLIGAYAALSYAIEDTSEKIEKLNEQYSKSKDAFSEAKINADKMRELVKSFEELRSKGSGRTNEEDKEFIKIQNQIKELLPSVSGSYDEMGNFIISTAVATDSLTAATDKLLAAKMKEMDADASKMLEAQTEQLGRAYGGLEELSGLWNRFGKNVEEGRKGLENANIGIGDMALSVLFLSEKISDVIVWFLKLMPLGDELADTWQGWFDIMFGKNPIDEQKKKIDDLVASQKEVFGSLVSEESKSAYIDSLRGMGEEWATQLADELQNGLEKPENQPEITPTVDTNAVTAEMEKAYNDLIEVVIDMIKQKKEAEKDALKDELDGLKDSIDAQKDYYKYQLDEIKRVSDEKTRALKREMDAQKKAYESQKKAIEQQLENYKKQIDNQKELLQLQREADDYERNRVETQDELSSIEGQIAELMFDTSEEGVARRMELEAEAARIREELAQAEADRQYELQIEALDAEVSAAEESADLELSALELAQENYEAEYDLQLQQIEDEEYAAQRRYEIISDGLDAEYEAKRIALENQISQIDDYLKQEGTIRNDAIDKIKDKNSGLYKELMDWNKQYGSGIDSDIISMWDLAMQKVQGYANAVASIPALPSMSTQELFQQAEANSLGSTSVSMNENVASNHDGIDSGFIGGKAKLKSNEEFRKVLEGEIVLNPEDMDKFMTKTLPAMIGTNPQIQSNSGGFEIGNLMNIVVNGSLDSKILPDIEKISQRVIGEINKVMLGRGIKRRADAFSQ